MQTIQRVIGVSGAVLLIAASTQLDCDSASNTPPPDPVADLAVTTDASVLPDGATAGAPTVRSVSPPSGPNTGATLLTVSGTGFQAGVNVTVGGSPCQQLALISDTQLNCLAPPKSVTCGAQDVVVINPDGQRATAAGAYLYRSGTFGFGALSANTMGAQPDQLVVRDLNQDGKLDLVNTNRGGGSITYRLGTGTGTFGSLATLLTSSGGPAGLAAADASGV